MNVLKFLEENVKPATGCTEPAAIGYATSLAYNAIHGNFPSDFSRPCPEPDSRIRTVSVLTDRDVYKNALAITIPCTGGKKGIPIASAMGLYGNPKHELNIFETLPRGVISKAEKLVNLVSVEKVQDSGEKAELDICVTVNYVQGETTTVASTRLQHYHNHVSYIEVNGKKMYEQPLERSSGVREVVPASIADMIDIAKDLDEDERRAVLRGVDMNWLLAKEGLRGNYGLNVGSNLSHILEIYDSYILGKIDHNIIDHVRIAVAAAGDARMNGAKLPAMSTSGSGNQGILALLPVFIVGSRNNISNDRIAESAMLSHLVTSYTSSCAGHLSALCGCAIKAGIGSAAGLTYLLGGDNEQVNNAINIMAANICGILCDGAKGGCALKLSTAAGTATESALMAMNGMSVPSDNGIVSEKAEETLKNIGKISYAMVPVDLTIVDIMQGKK